MAAGFDANVWFRSWRAGAADGAVPLGWQMGAATAPASGSNEPYAAIGLRLLAGDCVFTEKALPVGRGEKCAGGAEIGMDQRSASARHRVQAAHAQPHDIRCDRPGVLCHLGILHMAAEPVGTRTGCGFPLDHAAVDQAF